MYSVTSGMANRRTSLLLLVCLGLSACASLGPPLPPSLELPKPPIDLRASRKGDKVTLTWTVPRRTTDRRRVRFLGNAEICRGLDPVLKTCGQPVGEAAAPAASLPAKNTSATRITATFVDALPASLEQDHPSALATYAVVVTNKAGRAAGLSNQVHVPLVPTLPPFSDFSAKVVANGIFISWRCAGRSAPKLDHVEYLFRIYRRTEAKSAETKIYDSSALCLNGSSPSHAPADLPADKLNDFVASFLDQTIEWEQTYYYRGTVVSVVAEPGKPPVEVEGDDTPEVKVFADDVFPPAVPAGVQAVFSGPGQQPFIDLIWSPVTDADLAGYNIYRHEAGSKPVKLNAELVKTPSFRDEQVVAGHDYFYSVTSVDERGNESARSEEASERVP
jgi:hypothetical protein